MTLNQLLQEQTNEILSDAQAAIARERFEAGFDLSEVQTAFNVLDRQSG
jgi:hypothetical protein